MIPLPSCSFFFFFNDTATTEIYTLSLHDALPIYCCQPYPDEDDPDVLNAVKREQTFEVVLLKRIEQDRKSTRLNSSHVRISYAVFCLKKKKKHRMLAAIFYEQVHVSIIVYHHTAP